jgi:catechol 2,3-dioxygenase-like lactoylglutathione lyase family enzyme
MSSSPAALIGRLTTKITTLLYREVRAFYEGVMGFPIVEEWAESGDTGCILAVAEGAHLEINLGEPAGLDGLSLQFRVESVEDFKRAMGDLWQIEGPVKRPWGSTYLYMRDPAGVRIVVFEGGN